MKIATTQKGHEITANDAIQELKERITGHSERYDDIGYVCSRNTRGKVSAVWVKVGCQQRIKALQKTIDAIIEIECRALNGEEIPKALLSHVNRSLSHVYGKLHREEQK